MRITGCHIAEFGQFDNLSLDGLDNPLVVILGPNEAGKSTLFQFMVTMLYGFSPAEASRHPYLPRNGTGIGGSLTFRAGTSRCTVERRLRSTPKGILSIGSEGLFGTRESIRNRPLRLTGDVSREVYEAVYALTLHDMVHVSGRAWHSIQDRLLGGLNLETLRIARDVVEEVETEARRLWRPDRRGKTLDQELREKLRELRLAAREARERDARIRDIDREIEEMTERLRSDEERSRTLRRLKSRSDRLVPIRARLRRIDQLREEAGDVTELECIPDDPQRRLEELDGEMREAEQQAAHRREAIAAGEQAMAALSPADAAVLGSARAIRTSHSRLALFTQRRFDVDRMESRMRQLGARRSELASRLVSEWTDAAEAVVRSVSVSDLRETVRRYARYKEDAELARARREGAGMGAAHGSAFVWWTVLFVAAVLGIVGLVIEEAVVWGPAFAVATVSAGFLLQSLMASRASRSDHTGASDALEPVRQAREDVGRVLRDLPLSEARLRDPDPELAVDLQALQAVLAEMDSVQAEVSTLQERLRDDDAEVAELLRRVGVHDAESPEAELTRLFDRLPELESLKVAAEQAAASMPTDRERLQELIDRREELRQAQADLRQRLASLADGDYLRGVRVAVDRRQAAARAATVQEELEAAHPDLPAVIREIERHGGDLPSSPEAAADLEDAMDQAARALQDGHAAIAGLRANLDSLLQKKTVAEIENEVSILEEQVDEVRKGRDRLMLLADVIRHADARFRDRHQPDVIRRASDIVRRLTNGHYSALEVDDEAGTLTICEDHEGLRLRVGEPLSRGTLDQIYLSLRLGLADHLDSAGERLPLFLDEVLVNWDADRRRAASKLLSEVASSRQIFFFTCHDWLADEISHLAGAHVVKL